MESNARKITITALFVALVFLLGLTPVGLIPLGFINVTILCIPVIVGTIVLGLKTGMLLGFTFGLVSTLSMMGFTLTVPSGLASALFAANPLYAIVMCMVPRLLVPVTTHLVFRLASRRANRYAALPAAAIIGSATNTILYLGAMLLFYWLSGLDYQKILLIIGGTGLIAGSAEAAAAAIIASPVAIAIWKSTKGVET